MIQDELRRFEDALARFDRALQLKPKDPALLSNRGNVLLGLGRLDDAPASFDVGPPQRESI